MTGNFSSRPSVSAEFWRTRATGGQWYLGPRSSLRLALDEYWDQSFQSFLFSFVHFELACCPEKMKENGASCSFLKTALDKKKTVIGYTDSRRNCHISKYAN